MTYEEAKRIAAGHAPDLVIDPPYDGLPALFVIRKTANGAPHSLHLPDSGEPDEQRTMLVTALDGAVAIL